MWAFKKYSNLCMPTNHSNDMMVTAKLSLRLKITMKVLEIRLPTTGNKPAKNVTITKVPAMGKGLPIKGKMPSKYTAVNTVLMAEILIWA